MRWHVVALLLLLPAAARAADTLEPWEEGAGDVDMYLGWDGLGHAKKSRHLSAELMVGYGLRQWLSVYAGSATSTAEDLSAHETGLYVGAYGPLVASDHLDVDWILDLTVSGPGLQQVQVLPMLEISLDLVPDLRCLGMYSRVGLPVSNTAQTLGTDPMVLRPGGTGTSESARTARQRLPRWDIPALTRAYSPKNGGLPGFLSHLPRQPPAQTGGSVVNVNLQVTVGAYWTFLPGQQVLAELDLGHALLSEAPARPVDLGGLSLGYNFQLGETLEMINQVFLDIPQPGEQPSVGVTSGFILTIPPPA